jgi:nucleobase:cation symporter-1, NCS1 family
MFVTILSTRQTWLIYRKNDMPNSMPANAGTDTKAFVGFFLFWAGSLIAIWFPVHQIKVLFTVKAYFVPVAGVAFFIWSIKKAGGVGPIVRQPGTATGSDLAWGFIKGIMSSIANFATLIVVSILYDVECTKVSLHVE